MFVNEPFVSVIIPTINRPKLLMRAVNSVLTQNFTDLELIIVIDGPDETTLSVLSQITDSRLKILALPQSVKLSSARNIGVEKAKADWVAFLDDDDEWLPTKLCCQLEIAKKSKNKYPIISCFFIVRNEKGDLVWPLQLPNKNEILSEYFFCQKSIFGGQGVIVPSTILTKKELLLKIPFSTSIVNCEDIDWMLRAVNKEDARIEFVENTKPLLIYYAEENRARILTRVDWQNNYNWWKANQDLFTKKAYISCLLINVAVQAARTRDRKVFWLLLKESYKVGRPRFLDLLAYFLIWGVSKNFRDQVKILLSKLKLHP